MKEVQSLLQIFPVTFLPNIIKIVHGQHLTYSYSENQKGALFSKYSVFRW